MIKKLRMKFIVTNMVFVISILAVVLGIFYYANLKRIRSQSEMALMQAIERERFNWSPDKVEPGRRPREFHPPLIPVFVVILNQDKSIETIRENNLTISKELADTLVNLVEEAGTPRGILKDYSLRYLKMDTREGTKISFADLSYEWNNLKSLLISCIAIFFAAVILFLLLSLYLSRQALKPVEAAWQQQNQFIADASHELKTPLTVILANLQILSSHKDSTILEQKKWLDNTREEAARMKQLVDELLFLARSDAGKIQTVQGTMAPFDFSDGILNSVLLFESVAFENKIDLSNEIQPGIILEGNEQQLKQMANILLDNACKYAGKSGFVSVVLKSSAHHAVLTVENTGEPIPPEEQKHIFERFYRTDKSRVRKEGGYGLGLAIAKTIIDQHKGKITVTSSPEANTVFTVTLPLSSGA